MQILIAEDNPINQKLVDLICRKAGYQTRIVPDGSTAVDAIREGGIGLVLMDVMMPRMDGIEATRQIRRLARRRVPVLRSSRSPPIPMARTGRLPCRRHERLPRQACPPDRTAARHRLAAAGLTREVSG